MALVESFELTLKEVVNGKRLSASKMSKLTEIALKNMENDTQLVSVLYRTHKSLPATAKVHSLYAFDALCRAARHQATKQGLTGDIHSEKGNCATFLLKVEGVLDGLIQDMASTGTPDSKEKTKKILDIWSKSSTFPAPVLTRLTELATKGVKETNKTSTSTSDPRSQRPPSATPTPPIPTPAPAPPVIDPAQAALLALLTSAAAAAANSANGQTPTNTGAPAPVTAPASQPQLDSMQLALLQQLTNKANLGSVSSVQPVPLPLSLVPQQMPSSAGVQNVYATAGPSQSQPHHRDQHPDSDHRDPRFSRYDNTGDRGRGRDDFYEDRRGFRGGPRGGFRGRGRDDFRGRFEDRDRFRDRDDDRGPPRRRRSRSRSRSPPSRSRYAGRRDVRPYSPPRRPSVSPVLARDQDQNSTQRPAPPGASASGKDEFGRDIRPVSPEPDAPSSSMDRSDVDNVAFVTEGANSPSAAASSHHSPPAPLKSPSHEHDASTLVPMTSGEGLDKFDYSTFDPTNPASWKLLGNAFQVTNGYLPSQEELLQLLSGGMMATPAVGGNQPIMVEQGSQWSDTSWGGPASQQDSRGRGGYRGGRGRGRGWSSRGAYGYGGGRAEQGEWGYAGNSFGQESEAVVLGGGDDSVVENMNGVHNDGVNGGAGLPQASPMEVDNTQETLSGGGSSGGQMRKVGDKWVFVREGAMGVA